MARLFINNDTVSRETFLPGQVFVVGSFMFHADPTIHLDKDDSYAHGH